MSISDPLVDVDVFKKNAYSEDPKFDLLPIETAQEDDDNKLLHDNNDNVDIKIENVEISLNRLPPKEWEVDVRGLISTKQWLSNYGLKRNRLDMRHILPIIGFRHSDEFDAALRKPICSRYGTNLFKKYLRSDGQSFNIYTGKEKLKTLEIRLNQAIYLYKRRLEWLTTESRRIFGVILERSVTIVLDFRNLTQQQFDQYRSATELVIKEQISQLSKFNFVRVANDIQYFKRELVSASEDNLESAIEWLWNLEKDRQTSATSSAESVLKAVGDPNAEAIYLFSEGSTCEKSMHLLKEKLTGVNKPVHVVSYNCPDKESILLFKNLIRFTGGRFHAYAVIMEMDTYEKLQKNENSHSSNVMLKRKTFGGVPPGAGIREDVLLLFEELEEARNNLSQIQGILEQISPVKNENQVERNNCQLNKPNIIDKSKEQYMSSREWLTVYGLKARKLSFFDVLSGVSFKHRDGVVDIKHAPSNCDDCCFSDEATTDAINKRKLVNAKYCNIFPHVRWKDGRIVHVQVTPEVHRKYASAMKIALESIQRRIDWLQQGSRELFGTVIEEEIYFLIDTSASMSPHISFVKDKLFVLMQEQLRHKQKFNLIAFNCRAYAWRDRMIDVTETNLKTAWDWVKHLECTGTTNTLAALKMAVNDPAAQAIYLLTDGRPNQPCKSILSQIQLSSRIPIHAISFNCADKEANEFLYELARSTAGRFHYYSENGIGRGKEGGGGGPLPWESEDIRLLKAELQAGFMNLEKVGELRDECSQLNWTRMDNRPKSAVSFQQQQQQQQYTPMPPPSVVGSFQPMKQRPQTSRNLQIRRSMATPLKAYHTKSSILRTFSSNGNFNVFNHHDDWILPESRKLLEEQERKRNERIKKSGKKIKFKLGPSRGGGIMSSKKWLKKHGLSAKKLTMVDVLGPSMIRHTSKYIPIINKSVSAKVYDNMPIEYRQEHSDMPSSSSSTKLVNPSTIDLKSYQRNLAKFINDVENRLNFIVWKCLSDDDKQRLIAENNLIRPKFESNRYRIIEALQNGGWANGIKETDILLLEGEIQKAKGCLQKANDLQNTIDKSNKNGDGDNCSGGGGGGGISKEDNSFDSDDTESENKKDDIDENDKKISEPIESKELILKRNKKKIKWKKSTVSRPRSGYQHNVIALNTSDWLLYQGKHMQILNHRFGLVHFTDLNKTEKVSSRFIFEIGGAIARPQLYIGDCVLTRVFNSDNYITCFVPGIVTMVGSKSASSQNMYSVRLFNGNVVHVHLDSMYKISSDKYNFLEKMLTDIEVDKILLKFDQLRANESEEEHTSKKQIKMDSIKENNNNEEASSGEDSDYCRNDNNKEKQEDNIRNEKESKLMTDIKNRLQQQETKTKEILEELTRFKENENLRKSENESVLINRKKSIYNDDDNDDREEESDKIQNDIKHSDPLLLYKKQLVLAKWPDDGWYYRSLVEMKSDNDHYVIRDRINDVEKIAREDIISDEQDADSTIRKGDAVIGLHPDYEESYAPAIVIDLLNDNLIKTKFYNGVESKMSRENVYKIDKEKYDVDVEYIVKCERRLINQVVLALNNKTGNYQLGLVQNCINNGKSYTIMLDDETTIEQRAPYIFSAFSRFRILNVRDYAIVPYDDVKFIYRPALITGVNDNNTVDVRFKNRETKRDINVQRCFWISKNFYQDYDKSTYE